MAGHLTEDDFQNAEDERFVRASNDVETSNDTNLNIFEGDIILDDYDYHYDITTNENKIWPKSGDVVIVPITFPSDASLQEKADIARVVREFANKTCIRYPINVTFRTMLAIQIKA